MRLSDNLFFTFEPEGITLWDFRSQRRYVVDESTILRLILWHRGQRQEQDAFDGELVECGILEPDTRQGPNYREWAWDRISYIFHFGTRYLSSEEGIGTKKEFIDELTATIKQRDVSALDIDTWLTGAFLDAEVESVLAFDVPREGAVFFVCAGVADGSAFHPIHTQAIEEQNSSPGKVSVNNPDDRRPWGAK